MERLKGKKVYHNDLGEGVIIDAKESGEHIIITVNHPNANETKKYGFPVALGKSLVLDEELLNIAKDIANAKEDALRKAEEERKAAELQSQIDKSKIIEEEGELAIKNTDRSIVFNERTSRVFKVHQGITFNEECSGGYIWAPADGLHHHEKMTEILPGDIIFHYSNGALVAVSEALRIYFNYPQLSALHGHGWGPIGYRVELRYEMLTNPFSLNTFRTDIIAKKASSHSSFDINGDACQGYMYELEYDLAILFKDGILSMSQPDGVIRVLDRI